MIFFNKIHERILIQSTKTFYISRRNMEKMDEDDVIIFSCATITLACALEIQKKPRRN